jgi:hypothetical protein
LRGNEEILQGLERDWEKVKFQTGWQLEYCTKPIVNPSPTDPPPATPTATTQLLQTTANRENPTAPVSNSSDVPSPPNGDNADAPGVNTDTPANKFLGI